MSKYKVGDKVFLEGEILRIYDNAEESPYYIGLKNNTGYFCNEGDMKCINKTYEDGLNDAWELVRKLADMPFQERADIFGYCCDGIVVPDILRDFTPQEALAKIEAYEKSQQIQVGDIIQHKDGTYGVVTRFVGGIADVLWEDGTVSTESYVDELHKTGKTRDISSILEQIRGNE